MSKKVLSWREGGLLRQVEGSKRRKRAEFTKEEANAAGRQTALQISFKAFVVNQ